MKNLEKVLFYGSLAFLLAFILLFFVSSLYIGKSVKRTCQRAQDEYSGDCTQALVAYLQDEDNSYHSRNSAIWALGQLGDSRATSVLQTYYTGHIPDREPLDQTISQYELKKALKLTQGGLNLTRPIWDNLLSI